MDCLAGGWAIAGTAKAKRTTTHTEPMIVMPKRYRSSAKSAEKAMTSALCFGLRAMAIASTSAGHKNLPGSPVKIT